MTKLKTQYHFKPTERAEWMTRLEHVLANGTLRQSVGPARQVPASEFELLYRTPNGIVGFKHYFSLNFVFLFTKPTVFSRQLFEAGTLFVPMENRIHMRGYFDPPEDPPCIACGAPESVCECEKEVANG